jgi:hypothetical protein
MRFPVQKNSHFSRSGGEVYAGFWWVNLTEGDHFEDLVIDGRIVVKWIFDKWDGGIDWKDLAQDKDRWRALVNALMNVRHP